MPKEESSPYFDQEMPSTFWQEYEADLQKRENVASVGYPIAKQVYKSLCKHTGNVKVFETPKVIFYGGGYNCNAVALKQGITIDLAGWMLPDPVDFINCHCPSLAKKLNEKANKKFISIAWADGSIVDWPKSFWLSLINDLETQPKDKKDPNKKLEVLVCCVGGHGRTGTALSILGGLLNFIPKKEDPIDWIRRIYCKEAVETKVQQDYIYEILGYEFK
jgi:hypothetical protein